MRDVPENVRLFWAGFQASIPYDASARFHEAFHFDDHEASANELAALVLSGRKRATAGLLWVNEFTGNPPPAVGAFSVVTDWQGAPLCVIETTRIEIVPYDDVSQTFAAIEGEGDGTLRYWREVHWDYFSRECRRIGRQPDPKMPVVCEQFKVVYPAAESDA